MLVNPLHAAEPVAPMEPSPYLPTSRRFANPLYLRVERMPEYADLDAAARERVEQLRAELQAALRDVDRIDRDTVWAAKRAALQLVHDVPRSDGRQAAYCAYRRREGDGLTDFATWCAIAEVHGPDWRAWPAELRAPAFDRGRGIPRETMPTGSISTAGCNGCWTSSWPAPRRPRPGPGMALGIMHDLAVGVHPDGADTWRCRTSFAQGITVGAPPDAFNQNGQDWSQPPWRPDRLAELAYAPFRDMVSTVLRHAGGIRVDHIIGLFRLWWIPAGPPPTAGTYVRYDHEAMIGILALEAHRAHAVVVGEDLGTVEPWVRDYLRERGILGTSILWFEFECTPAGHHYGRNGGGNTAWHR